MRIKKYPHSAIAIEEGGTKIIVDPGIWSPGVENETGVSAIFITHEHPDHYDPIRILTLLAANPEIQIVSNENVVEQLNHKGIPATAVKEGGRGSFGSISYSVHGKDHARIDADLPVVPNRGFLFNDRLYHPGDALHNPGMPIEILALPIMAPWARISDMLDYIRELKPRKLFPIHDALLTELGPYEAHTKRVVESIQSMYIHIKPGEEEDF